MLEKQATAEDVSITLLSEELKGCIDQNGVSGLKQTIIGDALPNIPWQDRPAGCSDMVWRYDANPVIPRDLFPGANSIFNSAVVPFNGDFAGVFIRRK